MPRYTFMYEKKSLNRLFGFDNVWRRPIFWHPVLFAKKCQATYLLKYWCQNFLQKNQLMIDEGKKLLQQGYLQLQKK
jgi:hypothetical protein